MDEAVENIGEWCEPEGWSFASEVFAGDFWPRFTGGVVKGRRAIRTVGDDDGHEWVEIAYFSQAGEMIGAVDRLYVMHKCKFEDFEALIPDGGAGRV